MSIQDFVLKDHYASNIRTFLKSILNSLAFICVVNLFYFISRLKVELLVQQNKERKVLLSSFHLNGHTLGFHSQTQKLESPCTT